MYWDILNFFFCLLGDLDALLLELVIPFGACSRETEMAG